MKDVRSALKCGLVGLSAVSPKSLRMLYVPIEIKHDKLDIHKSSPKWTPHTQRWNIMAIVKCSISAHCFGAFQDESARDPSDDGS